MQQQLTDEKSLANTTTTVFLTNVVPIRPSIACSTARAMKWNEEFKVVSSIPAVL